MKKRTLIFALVIGMMASACGDADHFNYKTALELTRNSEKKELVSEAADMAGGPSYPALTLIEDLTGEGLIITYWTRGTMDSVFLIRPDGMVVTEGKFVSGKRKKEILARTDMLCNIEKRRKK